MILTFSDGYNGDVKLFDSRPIEDNGRCVKLRCVSPGFEYCTRWVMLKEYNSKMVVFVYEV